MSTVTNIIVICGHEPHGIAYINTFLRGREDSALEKVPDDQYVGGNKIAIENDTWRGAFNNMKDAAGLVHTFLDTPWRYPENAILLIEPHQGPTRVFRPKFEDTV